MKLDIDKDELKMAIATLDKMEKKIDIEMKDIIHNLKIIRNDFKIIEAIIEKDQEWE